MFPHCQASMTQLIRLRRTLLLAGSLLVLLHLCLLIGIAWPSEGSQVIILPKWADLVPVMGLLLLATSQLVAMATRRGWWRAIPLVVLMPLFLFAMLAVGLVSIATQRVEADRITLPDGRVVMMTYEPVPTDTVFAVWEQVGKLRWRPLHTRADEITYSEDHSFTDDPRLVVSNNGRYLLVRRGGIWTDCWSIGTSPAPCLRSDHPLTREQWLARSQGIAAVIGTDPA
jgi:hypothetical protein